MPAIIEFRRLLGRSAAVLGEENKVGEFDAGMEEDTGRCDLEDQPRPDQALVGGGLG